MERTSTGHRVNGTWRWAGSFRYPGAVVLATCVALLGFAALPSLASAYQYNDSWEVTATNFESNGNVMFSDPCVGGDSFANYYVGSSCQWGGAAWQFHNWTAGEVEQLSTRSIDGLGLAVSKSNGAEPWWDWFGESGQYDTLFSTAPGSYDSDNVAVGVEWLCGSGCGTDLLWGWSGQ
jgi:hypothetical protein